MGFWGEKLSKLQVMMEIGPLDTFRTRAGVLSWTQG